MFRPPHPRVLHLLLFFCGLLPLKPSLVAACHNWGVDRILVHNRRREKSVVKLWISATLHTVISPSIIDLSCSSLFQNNWSICNPPPFSPFFPVCLAHLPARCGPLLYPLFRGIGEARDGRENISHREHEMSASMIPVSRYEKWKKYIKKNLQGNNVEYCVLTNPSYH